MTLANTVQQNLLVFFFHLEVVARDGAPAYLSRHSQAGGFIQRGQSERILRGDMALPSSRVPLTVCTFHRIVRIYAGGKRHFGRSVRSATATPRVHGGESVRVEFKDKTAGGFDGFNYQALSRRRRAQKLAMGGVAEIEVLVPALPRYQIGSSGNGLRF